MRFLLALSLCLVCLACSEDNARTDTPTPSLPPVALAAAIPTPEPSPSATPAPTPPQPVQTTTEPAVSPSPRPIGHLDVGAGAHVKFFTTLPGSQGTPNTTVRIATGRVEVFEIYDWSEHHEELKGQTGHTWYRVDPDESHWIFGLEQCTFTPAE